MKTKKRYRYKIVRARGSRKVLSTYQVPGTGISTRDRDQLITALGADQYNIYKAVDILYQEVADKAHEILLYCWLQMSTYLGRGYGN